MKNKLWIWVVTIISAIPVPFSLITILGSIISIANIGSTSDASVALVMVAVLSMMLAGTYSITYIVATVLTFVKKRLSIMNLLPPLHILLTILSCFVWSSL